MRKRSAPRCGPKIRTAKRNREKGLVNRSAPRHEEESMHEILSSPQLFQEALAALHPDSLVREEDCERALALLNRLDDPDREMLSLLRSAKFKFHPDRHGDLSAWALAVAVERLRRQEARKKAEARSKLPGGGCYICDDGQPVMRDEFGGLICAECRARYLAVLRRHQQQQFFETPPRADVAQ
jgi:hypothetical protein